LCKLSPPITCYPCASFVAFRDADHRAVERALQAQMDDRPSTHLEEALEAVREVIELQAAEEAEKDGAE
jgi:hypothetical protein